MVTVEIPVRRIVLILGLAALLLAVAHLAAQWSAGAFRARQPPELVRLFNLNAEANVPTWFSSSLLLLCSLLLAVVGAAGRSRGNDVLSRQWVGLSLVFALLSLDEAAAIHETSVRPLRAMLGASGPLHFTWVVPGALFVLAFALANLRFLRALPRRTRRLMLLGGALYVAGALGMEMVGGMYQSSRAASGASYRIVMLVEEVVEMLGLVTFLYALLDHVARELPEIRLSFR